MNVSQNVANNSRWSHSTFKLFVWITIGYSAYVGRELDQLVKPSLILDLRGYLLPGQPLPLQDS